MPRESLTIDDFSDREFLLIVVDAYDADGWADSQEVADRLDLVNRRFASSRLSWLARFGAVEREHRRDATGNLRWRKNGQPMWTQRWRLTAAGEALALGRLRKGDETALARLKDDQLLLVTRWLTQRSGADGTTAKLVQREWRHGHARRDGRA